MDERREERLELEAIARADRDDAREAAEARAFWQDEGLEPWQLVTAETERWGG